MEFKELPQYHIKISRCGVVVNTKRNKVFKGTRDQFGYAKVCATLANGSRRGLFVHRLLAEAFIPNPDKKPFVNHIDGDKKNNALSNLEWCTHKENMRHAKNLGLWTKEMGREKYGPRNKIIKNLFNEGVSREILARAFGMNRPALNQVISKSDS